jgi:hypothetical protein
MGATFPVMRRGRVSPFAPRKRFRARLGKPREQAYTSPITAISLSAAVPERQMESSPLFEERSHVHPAKDLSRLLL